MPQIATCVGIWCYRTDKTEFARRRYFTARYAIQYMDLERARVVRLPADRILRWTELLAGETVGRFTNLESNGNHMGRQVKEPAHGAF